VWHMRASTLVLGVIVAALLATPQSATSSPTGSRFLERPLEALREFRAARHLEAANARFNKRGWMDVCTHLSGDGTFSVDVLAEGGSAYIRRKVLQPVLDGERDFIARGGASNSSLTPLNYAFTDETDAEPGVVRLGIKPLRRELTLIDGAVFVTRTGDLVRVEGRLARNPSFWTTRVDVVRRYGRVAGVRVPLSMESVAHVRIAGTSTMTMTYRYSMVNGIMVTDPGESVIGEGLSCD
jgi:hypothetical protein